MSDRPGDVPADVPADLVAVLDDSRRLGFLGPGSVLDHVDHARGMGRAAGAELDDLSNAGPAGPTALDLGAGGGVPGLVLAVLWPGTRWLLLDSQARRTAFLDGAVQRLGLGERVSVRRSRAEPFGRSPGDRERYAMVTARGFGPPAVTAECAAPLLRIGGILVVSEPPDSAGERWPADGLAALGLRLRTVRSEGSRVALLEKTGPCPAWAPRRTGRPAKHPLF